MREENLWCLEIKGIEKNKNNKITILSGDAFLKTWYQVLKFEENPLDIRPNPNILVGLEEEEEKLVSFIRKGDICFLNGLTGSGKTSLLQKIKKNLKEFDFIYLNAEDLPKNFDLEEAIKQNRNFLDYISFRKYPKKPQILLIDEFQATDPNLILEAKGKWENPSRRIIHSIVIAQISSNLRNASGSFKDRLGKRIIKLRLLDETELKEVLKKRLYNKKTKINYIDKFAPEALDLLVRCANGSVRRLLEYADLIFDFHHRRFGKNNPIVKSKDYKIPYHGVKEILTLHKISVKPFEDELKREALTEFEKKFTKLERRVMRYLLAHEAKSVEMLAKKLRKSKSTIRKVVSSLKEKDILVVVDKKGKKLLWDLTPHAKRLMVKY